MTDYPRCKTCKYWDDRGRPLDRLFDCNNEKVLFGQTLDEADTAVGAFYPGPDFGCVHHEPKESE